MKLIPPLYLLLTTALLGMSGCGESQQGAGTAPSDAKPAAAQTTVTPPAGEPSSQSAMTVRPAERDGAPPTSAAAQPATATPLPAPATAAPPPAPATPAAPTTAPAAPATPPSTSAKGVLLKESELKEKPFIDAPTLAKLAAQTSVAIRERSGGWFRVAAGKSEGWVRMLNIKVTEGAESLGSGTDLTRAAALATGRAGTGNVVSTSGLRGLDEEELRSAKPDYAQFDKLNANSVDKGTASSYAKRNGLTGRTVQYLPAK